MSRLKPSRFPVVLLLLTGLLAAGCGDDSLPQVVTTQHMVTTEDNVQIALHRYQLSTGSTAFNPILLCPGFSENHLAFDLQPDVSVARYLAALGVDTWVIDFRGRGESGFPDGTGLFDGTWSIDDYGYFDIRAAVAFISSVAPEGKMFLLGFSEGDAASVAFMLEGDTAPLAGYIGLGPGTVLGATNEQPDGDFPAFQYVANALAPAGYVMPANMLIPFAAMVDMLTEMAEKAGVVDLLLEVPLWNIIWNMENMTDEMVVRVLTDALGDVSTNQIKQYLKGARYFDRKGICTFRNSALEQKAGGPFCYPDRLSEIQLPLLVLAGSVDLVVPPVNAKFLFDRYSSTDKTFQIMGKDYGAIDNYGHDDLTFGIHVNQDISPVIANWIMNRM